MRLAEPGKGSVVSDEDTPAGTLRSIVMQILRDCFVRGQHEFFDQLMRLVIFHALQPDRLAGWIDVNFHFRKIEVQRTMREACAPKQ